ncbi:MAG: hypothetical protein VCB25_07905 [Myxococcota bacterium]
MLLISLAFVAEAQTVSVPHIFTNGSVADADDMNENFDTLESEIELVRSELALLRATPQLLDGISGACVIRNGSSSLNGALEPLIGDGFAKITVQNVNDINGLLAQCSDIVFDQLLTEYCKHNTESVQRQVVTYSPITGNFQSSVCAAQGCSSLSCP